MTLTKKLLLLTIFLFSKFTLIQAQETKKIELNAFTSRIGQSTVYAYTIENPTFLVDFKTSYHYSKHIELKCTSFMEHDCNVDLFYDSSSKYLVLVEEIYGPNN